MKKKILSVLSLMLSSMGMCFGQSLSTETIIINAETADTAYLTVYHPEKPSGVAIVCCPGGGYSHLSMENEGSLWAPFFNNLGITFCRLKYRMPHGNRDLPMSDALAAMRIVRSHKTEWHINPGKVGIMGFSAGGHLAATTATLAPEPSANKKGVSQSDTRPDFEILFYPVISMDQSITHKGSCLNFLGEQGSRDQKLIQKYSCQNNVTKDTPKALLIWGESDKAVPPATNVMLYKEALDKAGIPNETMSFPNTGHGFGFLTKGLTQPNHDKMLDFMTEWLKKLNYTPLPQTFDMTKRSGKEPFFFSVNVPDGNYKVTVQLGSKKAAGETVVKAESRRVMTDVVKTAKGKFATRSFIVNKRSPRIEGSLPLKGRAGGEAVSLKPREKDYMDWDDSLTLEFNGSAPAVKSITIEPDTTATTIFLCGNSTVVDQAREPWCSWGQMIPQWFMASPQPSPTGRETCTPTVAISNHAESGLTARTFINSNRLEKVLSMMKKGDYVFCEFGHNDEKEHYDGDGAHYHFPYQLKIFIDKVRKKGGNIVFVTPTQRRTFDKGNKTIRNSHGDFPDVMREVAQREKVPVIDLNKMTKTFYEALGPENSKKAFVFYKMGSFPGQQRELADNTHFSCYGAYEISKMIATSIKQQLPDLATGLLSTFKDFDPGKPDSFDDFVYFRTPIYDVTKPDGN